MSVKKYSVWPLCLALLLSLIQASAAEEPAGQPAKPVLLLTGFEPFGGEKVNASWEVVKTFQEQEVRGYRVETLLLPVVYDAVAKPLQEALAKHKPALVICFGVGTKVIQVETIARNSYHPLKPLDNKNNPPPRNEIIPSGPAEIKTALPADGIVAALKAAQIGAGISTDAGGYLCNECFYRLMNCPDGPAVRGFIHVPALGAKDPAGGVFDLEKLKRAARTIIETAIRAANK